MSRATDGAKRERQTWNQKGGRTSSWPPQHHHHRHDGHILCITQPERDRESEKVPFWVVVCSFSLGGDKKKSERENKKKQSNNAIMMMTRESWLSIQSPLKNYSIPFLKIKMNFQSRK
jgi:hypothetical protein